MEKTLKTKSKYLAITLSCIVFIMNISVLNAHSILLVSSDFFSELFKFPVHVSVNQNYDHNNQVAVTKANLKLSGMPDKNIKKIKNFEEMDLFKFGLAYKYYFNNFSESYPTVDFCLFSLKSKIDEDFPNFLIFKILERDTRLEFTHNYNFLNAGINFGFNFFNRKSKYYLVPMLHISGGVNSYQLDSVLFKNIDPEYLKTIYEALEGGVILFFQHKNFSFECNLNTYLNIPFIFHTSSMIRASYRINENLFKNEEQKNSDLTFISCDIIYRNEYFKFKDSNSMIPYTQYASSESINLNLTFNLNWILTKSP